MLYFFLFFISIWILFAVFADIFRSRDLDGWGKAVWVIFVIVVPYLGVFVYLIARGHKMSEHAQEAARLRTPRRARTSRARLAPAGAPPTSWRGSPTSRRRA